MSTHGFGTRAGLCVLAGAALLLGFFLGRVSVRDEPPPADREKDFLTAEQRAQFRAAVEQSRSTRRNDALRDFDAAETDAERAAVLLGLFIAEGLRDDESKAGNEPGERTDHDRGRAANGFRSVPHRRSAED